MKGFFLTLPLVKFVLHLKRFVIYVIIVNFDDVLIVELKDTGPMVYVCWIQPANGPCNQILVPVDKHQRKRSGM